jgi:hypothetical protein
MEVAAFSAVALLIADIAWHRRVAERDGVNRRGYRGPIARQLRQPRENRLVVVGGSAAFGYGRPLDETFPAYLERNLQQRWRVGFRAIPSTVINLAAVPDDAATFEQTLRDYADLDYGLVCFYDGYNSLGASLDERSWRRESIVFRRAGYLPLLPSIVSGEPAVGRPRITAANGPAPAAIGSEADARCGPPWDQYCRAMNGAVGYVLQSGRTAIVVTPPLVSPAQGEQQRAVAADLRNRYGRDPRFRYLDFGSVLDLRDRAVSFDGVHLTAAGNDRIADLLTGPVLQLLQ